MRRNKKGFSLLELVVVMAIMVIMSGVVIASISGNKTNKDLEAAAREIEAAVREAQNDALTGKQVDPAKVPCKFKFVYTGNSNTYKIQYYYHDQTTDCSSAAGPVDLVSYLLKNGVTFNNGNPNSFDFSVPSGTILYDDIIVILVGKDSKNDKVCIYPSGRVLAAGVGVSCPAPED
jgi:prepilin-type N-terminal cleavage/methylation domain-containing protein